MATVVLIFTPVALARSPARRLAQAPWEDHPTTPTVIPIDASNKTVTATTRFDTRLPNYSTGDVYVRFNPDDPQALKGVDVRAFAAYPNPKFDNPNGWRFKTVANSSMVFVYPSDLASPVIQLSNAARADSKLAPASGLGQTYAEHNGTIESHLDVHAFGRPGLQYGTTIAVADHTAVSTVDYSYDYSVGTRMETDLGNGALTDGDYGATGNFIDSRADTALGSAAAGYINLGRAYSEDAEAANDPGAAAATAVGNAVAGGITIVLADEGGAFVGDYDDEYDTYENDVSATTRGRGAAEAGQVNIALAPNDDAAVSGTIRATAAQGAAVAGAFTLANAGVEAYQGVNVDARTAEYSAVAGNVGVSQAAANAEAANSATAKSTIGSALAFNIANSALAVQSEATGSADATTTTGQAAGVSATQSVGGAYSSAQGASSAATLDGNAMSLGSALAAAGLVSRAVATSAAASEVGQALSAGWAAALGGDADADVASSAATATGNAASVAQGYGLGVLQGEAVVANSAGAEAGSAGALAVGVATGLIQAQSAVASSAETLDGRAQSASYAVSAAGINSVARATSSSASETGDSTSSALAVGVGVLHGEAEAASSSGTGCIDCVSDSVANAISTGLVADSLARSASDTDKNPGNALANALAFGLISRTSNGGSARVAVGPGQAIAAGFAISGSERFAADVTAAAGEGDTGDDAAGDTDGSDEEEETSERDATPTPGTSTAHAVLPLLSAANAEQLRSAVAAVAAARLEGRARVMQRRGDSRGKALSMMKAASGNG
ncbi:hypothetical protein COO60DRAFT_1457499 [Scenedesmus sp. NREL 46B-D3]|nr:hypothetical protein COO60DRAFT_1457499 [Scenedesmus sp. NREL 46B-D3]